MQDGQTGRVWSPQEAREGGMGTESGSRCASGGEPGGW